MGYYTTFNFSEIGTPALSTDQFQEDFKRITSYNFEYDYGLNAKWYGYTEDMIELSKLYPTTIFIIEGDGEKSDDLWKAGYFNGSYQQVQAKLVYPEFDIQSVGNVGKLYPEYFL